MKNRSRTIHFLYSTVPGRLFLKAIMKLHIDRYGARFLWTKYSRPLVGWYIKSNGISVSKAEIESFRSFRDMFVRAGWKRLEKDTMIVQDLPGSDLEKKR